MIDLNVTLGDLVTANPARARTLEGLGLDYCCGGNRTLGEACAEVGRDVEATIDALHEVDTRSPATERRWDELDLADLARHVDSVHHHYLHAEVPRLMALGHKVREVHGDRHPELRDVVATFEEMWAALGPHLADEEANQFPACVRLSRQQVTTAINVQDLRDEHEVVGRLLDKLRELSGDFATPADGCASYQAFYTGLAELDGDTRLHVHTENNVLFPKIEALLARAG